MDILEQIKNTQKIIKTYFFESGLREYFSLYNNDINYQNTFGNLQIKLLNNLEIKNISISLNKFYNIEILLKDIHCYSALFIDNNVSKNDKIDEVHKNTIKFFTKNNFINIELFGIIGILVKMIDKFEKISTIFNNNNIDLLNDNIIDLHNYSTIGLMLYYKNNKT